MSLSRAIPILAAAAVVSGAGCRDDAEQKLRAEVEQSASSGGTEGEGESGTSTPEPMAGAEGSPTEASPSPAPAEPDPAAPRESEAAAATGAEAPSSALLDPSEATDRAPEQYTVKLETTEGDVHIEVQRDWAPLGADRFYNLVKIGFFDDTAFFRVIDGFVAQIGLHGDPDVSAAWRRARIDDDPVKHGNEKGTVTFATAGKNTRTTQFFINLADNSNLDSMGFAPFGKVRRGDMRTVEKLYSGYGEGAPRGQGPSQARIEAEGNRYLRASFPELDYTERATVDGRTDG